MNIKIKLISFWAPPILIKKIRKSYNHNIHTIIKLLKYVIKLHCHIWDTNQCVNIEERSWCNWCKIHIHAPSPPPPHTYARAHKRWRIHFFAYHLRHEKKAVAIRQHVCVIASGVTGTRLRQCPHEQNLAERIPHANVNMQMTLEARIHVQE